MRLRKGNFKNGDLQNGQRGFIWNEQTNRLDYNHVDDPKNPQQPLLMHYIPGGGAIPLVDFVTFPYFCANSYASTLLSFPTGLPTVVIKPSGLALTRRILVIRFIMIMIALTVLQV